MYCLYQTVNLINGRYYIGVHQDSTNLAYLGSGRSLKAAIKKYGRRAFRRDILAECETAEFAYQLEAVVVDEAFVADKRTYNRCVGGRGGVGLMPHTPTRGWKHTLEARQKITDAQLGRTWTSETKNKMRQSAYKREAAMTPEQREHRYEARISCPHRTIESRVKNRIAAQAQWVKQKAEGFSYTPEAIQNMSAAAFKREAIKREQRLGVS